MTVSVCQNVGVYEDYGSDCRVVVGEMVGWVDDAPMSISPGVDEGIDPGFLYEY